MPYIIDDSKPNPSVREDEQGAYATIAEAWDALNEMFPVEDDEPDEYPYAHQSQSGAEFMAAYYNSDSYINYLNG